MKIKLGIKRKLSILAARINLLKFYLIRTFLGYEHSNWYLRKVEKISLALIMRKNGAQIGNNCEIGPGITFHNCNNFLNLIIGNNCHIGKNCFIDLKDHITIGNNVTISMESKLITHFDVGKSSLSKKYPPTHKPIIIGNDVYIGTGTTVLMGCTIGESSMIGAHSLVNKSIEKNKLAVGVPARIIRE